MKWRTFFTFCVASLAAAVTWSSRGDFLEDPRLQRRHQAARILRDALGEDLSSPSKTHESTEHFRSAVDRAIAVLTQDSHAADELKRAINQADPIEHDPL